MVLPTVDPVTDRTDTTDRHETRRRIHAPADRIFSLLADPATHVAIDSSEMLLVAPDAAPVSAVGDTFLVAMDREPLGDIPLGRYTVENTITVFDPGRRLAWAPGAPGDGPLGHVYGYDLVGVDDATTDVTSYCDWTDVPDAARQFLSFPVISVDALDRTLDELARWVEGR